jgi:O-antigen ligase
MAARALAEDATAHLRRIVPAMVAGLGLGIALLAFDQASGNMFRLAVRGFPEWTERITFGLKPAVSVLALMLPLLLLVPGLSRAALSALLACAVAVALWLPGDSAKIATVAGLGVAFLARLRPVFATRAMAVGLALMFLAGPALLAAALARGPDLSALPPSAAHRVLIWDFTLARIGERPWLGWGMDASRSLPGHRDTFDERTLDRFGLTAPEERIRFGRHAAQLPLHPHNAALHIWLETGMVGAVLAAALLAALAFGLGATPSIASAGLGALASGIVTGFLSFGVWQPWWVATLMLAAVTFVALRRNAPPR